MHRVEIRVAGAIGRLATSHLPGFEATSGQRLTVISGRLGPDEDLVAVMTVLLRYGLSVVDSRLRPAP